MADTRWHFWIDVGGTFTDCIARRPDGELLQHKTLSSGVVKGDIGEGSTADRIVDSRRRLDPPHIWRGFELRLMRSGEQVDQRRVRDFDAQLGVLQLESPLRETPAVGASYELVSDQHAPVLAMRYLLRLSLEEPLPCVNLRLGTTRGTNALVTRSGAPTALVTTRGFGDILRIGYQSRPNLFALSIRKPQELFAEVVEIGERIDAEGKVLLSCDQRQVRSALAPLRNQNIQALAVSLLHACANPAHEQLVARVARKLGFLNVSLSHEVAVIRNLVARGDTTVVDAYLNPVLRGYLGEIESALHPESTVHVMTSSGGLTRAKNFRGKDSILSGPAGGVVGVARAAEQAGFTAAIGFDMGGTSTDVCRWAGELHLEYETEKAGVRVVTPMMQIETVAAGGGSLCQFDGVKLTVGPESAGAAPGPACYGGGGPLAVTDINFFLGKILPEAFPFALDRAPVTRQLQEQCRAIHLATGRQYTPHTLADGYLRIANTNMVEAIRCVTIAKGCDPRQDVLIAFGGAAPQHACAVAEDLGIATVLLHPCAGILSALGIGLAEVTVHREAGVYADYDEFRAAELPAVFARLRDEACALLRENETSMDRIDLCEALDLRFRGLDQSVTIRGSVDGDYRATYEREYLSRFGYLPSDRALEIVTARVTATGRHAAEKRPSHTSTSQEPLFRRTTEVYFDGTVHEARVYDRAQLSPGDCFDGPAVVLESISTTIVDPGWRAEMLTGGELLLRRVRRSTVPARPAVARSPGSTEGDPVLLEIFNKRFAAIATQMGTTLQQNARSVNVKERRDYSCAIFTRSGDLVVNAPHIPVHLGAMGETVRHVLENVPLVPGDVIVTNDPYHGGSHLPDVTVVTPVHDDVSGRLLFFASSRAHHAEIGGIAPGSMPAFSSSLAEEGVLIRAQKVVAAGESRMRELRQVLSQAVYPSRDPDLNLAEVAAQIAANRHGANALLAFVQECSWPVVESYMGHIQDAAQRKMRRALARLPDAHRSFTDHLDQGSPIALGLTITGDTARLDFTGTGEVLNGNLNANRAIVTAAVMYSLRCLIDEDIPLNQGVLGPIEIVLPVCLLNPPGADDPRSCPAMAGGNVETSQRIVDVVLGAFGIAAASQGTMNNLLFGDATFGYYETICGGAGATPEAPGADAVHTHMTNTRLTDPEVLESRYPVLLQEFSIRQGSGGAGRNPGGNGVVRRIEFQKALTISLLSQRRGPYPPYGLHGGRHGALGENWLIRRDGTRTRLPSAAEVHLEIGDVILIKTPGGGGWGQDPSKGRADPV